MKTRLTSEMMKEWRGKKTTYQKSLHCIPTTKLIKHSKASEIQSCSLAHTHPLTRQELRVTGLLRAYFVVNLQPWEREAPPCGKPLEILQVGLADET